ncbi:MAG: hypothetical protein COA54_10950 [Thiotrichaceae bacterium]|nr:MAG: hypothetical protein COA54_10950 [Thiotrichaceae bacterium]
MFFSNNFISHKLVFLWLILISSTVLSSELIQHSTHSERTKAAKEVTQQFTQTLGGHLKSEMKTNGPVKAIKVCKEIAPEIANDLSIKTGWRVTRVSTKPRNPLLGSPDQWERETLASFTSRANNGEHYVDMSKAEVVNEAGKSYFRFMKPLAVKPVCLNCHGSEDKIPETVKAELDVMYPFDQARNYKIGDLRGAISIKQPMDLPLRKRF